VTRVILLAGASGSGKSRLARQLGALHFHLDDFYRDADAPGLPGAHGIVDWDHAATWDADAAAAALLELLREGRTEVPVYSIAESRRVGTREVLLGDHELVVAEGIFAVELLPHARAAGLPVEPAYLDRSRTVVALLRLGRDLSERRKPPLVLLRRGLVLWHAQPILRRYALASGFTPLGMRAARREFGAPARAVRGV